jgi:hypothetical protein
VPSNYRTEYLPPEDDLRTGLNCYFLSLLSWSLCPKELPLDG